jgi:hypothetical protein
LIDLWNTASWSRSETIHLVGSPSRRAFAVMSSSLDFPTLTVERVQAHIFRVCEAANQNQDQWIFQSADAPVLQAASRQPTVDASLLFGIQGRRR